MAENKANAAAIIGIRALDHVAPLDSLFVLLPRDVAQQDSLQQIQVGPVAVMVPGNRACKIVRKHVVDRSKPPYGGLQSLGVLAFRQLNRSEDPVWLQQW